MSWRRNLAYVAAALAAVVVADWMAASWLLWSSYDRAVALLREPGQLRGQHVRLTVAELGDKPREVGGAELFAPANAGGFRLLANYKRDAFELTTGSATRVTAAKSKASFTSPSGELAESRRALNDFANTLPHVPTRLRIGLSVVLHPLLLGRAVADGEPCWRVSFAKGHALIANGFIRDAEFQQWHVKLQREPLASAPPAIAPEIPAQKVDGGELDKSLAAVLRILALQMTEVPREPDVVRREGNGSLEIKDGQRVLRLHGKPYDIGFQHGRLLAPNIKRLCERVIYGVGFYYSMEKGRWFLSEAAKLVERQRPFIAPEYFEELRGLADGAGLPLATVQAANIFPEFFHCSGVAIYGKATRGGTLLHARVLDYMTDVGLQDEAVVMAIEREGARKIVNVSYAGFIGSVTGMNEKQVAIGEMGGGGQGKWDGTPMSLLLRGALENCDTLEQAVDYMRNKPRTCEYYYVISDGKSRAARGIAATPERFSVVSAGEALPELPEPVDDAVLFSAGSRYKNLVKRVRETYGEIGPQELMALIRRPVAMRSNLHDAIFEPSALTLWIANASRHAPACDQPFVRYTFGELFGSN